MFVFGGKEEWSTKTVYGISAQTVCMLCCVTVCFGVLATVSGQQMALCSCLTLPTYFVLSKVKQIFLLEG
jgi:hypothetical protein